MALSGIYVRGKGTTFTRDPSHTTLEQTGRLGPPEVAHQRGQQVPAPSNAVLGSSHPSHACCHCLCLFTCHSPLRTQVSSWAPRNYVMHRGRLRLSLASDQSQAFLRTLISFFPVRNLHSSWCPVSVFSQCPRHLEAPAPTATCYSSVTRPTVWTAGHLLGLGLGLPLAISVYARMGERSVRRRVWMVFGKPCPQETHDTPASSPSTTAHPLDA